MSGGLKNTGGFITSVSENVLRKFPERINGFYNDHGGGCQDVGNRMKRCTVALKKT